MKKLYILLLAIPILAILLLRLSVWWFVGGVSALMAFVAYQFYASRYNALQDRTVVLEKEIEDLNEHLEKAVLKAQRAGKEMENIRQMKQQLLSVMSHEVRTPMNGILGTALLMQETPLTKEQQEYLTTIQHCGESLITTVNNVFVNDILDLSKIQQQGNKLDYKDFNLRDSIEEVLDLFADKAGNTGIELIYTIDENAPDQIIGDSKRLRQVLMNLVENAVKFTTRGEVFVGLHYTRHTSAGHSPEMRFEVRDTGAGMSKEQLKHLFTGIPGKKINKHTDTDPGLGLMICKKLVELMGGTIEVASEPGLGSTFSFSIPVTPSLKIVRRDARENEMANLENKQVLIVSGNATSRAALTNRLKSWNMQPLAVAKADQAFEILSLNKNIAAVLTDMSLPGMDGLSFARSVKEQYSDVRIIAMKPAVDKRYINEHGVFSSVLNKPVRQHLLRDHILNIFSPTNNKQGDTGKMSQLFAEEFPQSILIAEDNPINQKIATKILTSLGYKPAIANNGKEAVEMVSNEKFDVILMDVQMPEMDGLEATRMIRTCLQVQPVIIAMTANVMQGDRDACIQAGMDDYMSKPIELKELLNQLEKWYRATKEKRQAS